ncbi:hypothetical protein Tdes44962_MAKER01718 [Teratosphaeria destructans]|uniref:Uncharacterized protein n=1 Tax=Teratosphaeria destructans TaxID=418781 RepID=A0A9W7SXG7_9PEZI|nr:hypothetical protein Tdes44962_MAKER01718 [Teratosphaeria destructans]
MKSTRVLSAILAVFVLRASAAPANQDVAPRSARALDADPVYEKPERELDGRDLDADPFPGKPKRALDDKILDADELYAKPRGVGRRRLQ